MFGFRKVDVETTITRAVEAVVYKALGKAENAIALAGDLVKLREELETLKIEKTRKEEEFKTREREIEHKVGLERKRQEFEREQAKREASVSIREENLKADRKRFEEQLQFHESRFTAEVGYLKDILGRVLKRLPSEEITTTRRRK